MSIVHRAPLLVIASFAAGAACTVAGLTLADANRPSLTASDHAYSVSLDEVKRNLVFADTFAGSYSHAVTMSDGTVHQITLRSVKDGGGELVELTDQSANGTAHSFMGPNGTTTDGQLMISVKDYAAIQAAMHAHAAQRN